jgi:uncharacterized protein (TIGR02147 family)
VSETHKYRSLIQDAFRKRSQKNPRYSVRAFARTLGLNVSTVSEILSGKKVPSYRATQKILSVLDLSQEQHDEFLDSIAQAQRKRGLVRLNPVFRRFKKQIANRELSLELFQVISEWHHYAIMMLTTIDGFKRDYNWIARQLDITPVDAANALDRLLKVGLLKDDDGVLKLWTPYFTTADKQISTSALRNHQRAVLEKAIHSLENDPIDTRSMTSRTMSIDSDKIPEAKKRIETFTAELNQFLDSGRKNSVYELGICLYPLQKNQSLPKQEI